MAFGHYDDFVIPQDYLKAGFAETVAQNTNVFNAASRNAIVLNPNSVFSGHYEKEKFWDLDQISVARRDITADTTQAGTEVKEIEEVGVVLGWKSPMMVQAVESFFRADRTPEEWAFAYGQGLAQKALKRMVDVACICARAAIFGTSTVVHDASDGTVAVSDLISALAKMGDYGAEVQTLVLHSKQYYDLMSAQSSLATDRVAGMTIYEGTAGTLGLTPVVVDATGLVEDITTDLYYALLLVENAITITPRAPRAVIRTDPGYENIVTKYQSEGEFIVRIKGFAWDTSSGGLNPTDAALALWANWDKFVTSDKDGPGAGLYSQ